MRVAVIGGGAFGIMTALRLAESGKDVTLYERLPSLMRGATSNNQNRLHLGFHYPRDDETARQCVRGFELFCNEFPECIRGGFPNAYFIASEGSLTSPESFLRFCGRHKLAQENIDLDEFRPTVRNVDLGVLTGELVYDSEILRKAMIHRLDRSGVKVQTGQGVIDIDAKGQHCFELTLANYSRESYNAVVNCSYAHINQLTAQLGHRVVSRQYEYTAVAILDVELPQTTGITIMDGQFLTLLPYGKTSQYLLYHVQHTVICRDDAPLLNVAWLDRNTAPFASVDKEKWFGKLCKTCSEFIPALQDAKLRGVLEGPRMVLANREDNDSRPSMVTEHQPGYITVFSGKIDHCVWIADEVLAKLTGSTSADMQTEANASIGTGPINDGVRLIGMG